MLLFKRIKNSINSLVAEIKAIEWLDRKTLIRYTSIVIVISTFLGISIALLDKFFYFLIDKILTIQK